MERGHWDIDASATVNASQWFRHSNGRLIPLYCSKRKLTCFWAICHRLPLSRRTPVWLGRSSKNMYINGPESWSHSAIDSLNRSLLEQGVAIIASLKNDSTSLPVMVKMAGVNTASLGGYLHSKKKRARCAEGFHNELNSHVFDLERDRLCQVVLCPWLNM